MAHVKVYYEFSSDPNRREYVNVETQLTSAAECDWLIAQIEQMRGLFRGAAHMLHEGRVKGGYARAASMTPEQRTEVARKATAVRWNRDDLAVPAAKGHTDADEESTK